MAPVPKMLEYRFARWFDLANDPDNVLEDLLRKAWTGFPNQTDRTVKRSDGSALCGLRADTGGEMGFAFACSRYMDKQSIGTIPMTPATNPQIGEQEPAPDENFLNGEFFALVRNNHVISLNAGRNSSVLRDFIQRIFRKADFPDNNLQFELGRLTDIDKIKMIDEIGVKSIDLNMDIHALSAAALTEEKDDITAWSALQRALKAPLHAISKKDKKFEHLENATKGTMKLSINVRKGDLEAVKHSLDAVAEAIAEDDDSDSYIIRLRNEDTITPEEVALRKRVYLHSVANSVSAEQAWNEMRKFLGEIISFGKVSVL